MLFGKKKSKEEKKEEANDVGQEREMLLEVPENLHGLFLVEPLQISPSVDGYTVVALAVCRVCFFLLVTYFIQATYIVRLHVINRELEGGQCNHDLHLQIICIFVFAAAGFQELGDIVDLVLLLYWIPSSSQGYSQLNQTAGGEVFNAQVEQTGIRAAFWKMAGRPKKARVVKADWRLTGVSRLWKSICFCVIVVPRLLICFFLVLTASGFLMRAPEEKMIVDTVAALFVLEIGGFIFGAFITTEVKQQLAGLDGIIVVTSHRHRLAGFVFVHFFYPLACVCFAVVIVYLLRQECPDENSFLSSLLRPDSWKAVFAEYEG